MLSGEEKKILDEINYIEPMLLLDRFKDLARQSGSEDERFAAQYITGRLKEFGIEYELLWPEIYLSSPKSAELKIIGKGMDIAAKTPSYSVSTGDKWVDGELVFASSYRPPYASQGFEYKLNFDCNPKGKMVICEGIPSPDKINDIIENGGAAAIFVQSGEDIHEAICTSIWGTPGLDDFTKFQRIPVVSVKNSDGNMLISMIREGKVRAAVRTSLDEGWKKCPLVLAKIKGYKDPEKFILLHGHLDSWHYGIGDNAVGDAAILEICRVLYNNRENLKRSIWIAWWPGHSTGRFAGSTWFADMYAMDIHENCIAQVNCESLGCINADTYEDMMWTEDVDRFCRELIIDVTGIEPKWTRPIRAGDYSFNNIGVTSFFMRSSTIGKEKLKELGYYEVYGCGGNIEWHTEKDDMRVVDNDIFLRDTRLYAAGVFRAANSDIPPIDSMAMLDSMEKYLHEYRDLSAGLFDFDMIFDEISSLRILMKDFYNMVESISSDERMLPSICDAILGMERELIRINYTKSGEFMHDPAAMVPPVPDIAPVLQIHRLEFSSQKFMVSQLVRGRNRVIHALRECKKILKSVLLC